MGNKNGAVWFGLRRLGGAAGKGEAEERRDHDRSGAFVVGGRADQETDRSGDQRRARGLVLDHPLGTENVFGASDLGIDLDKRVAEILTRVVAFILNS